MAKLFNFRNQEGDFDYELYKNIQVQGNKNKESTVFVEKENIKFLAEKILYHRPECAFGICHGTRQGLEQKWFSRYLNCPVIGTEISDTAHKYENTIEWDFHQIKDEWISEADFIYSNSWDHSYDPEHCFRQWVRCLKPGGLMMLEHSSQHTPNTANRLDPFGAQFAELVTLLARWGRGHFFVREIVEDLPVREKNLNITGSKLVPVKEIRAIIVQKEGG